jgi:hypothetical protein
MIVMTVPKSLIYITIRMSPHIVFNITIIFSFIAQAVRFRLLTAERRVLSRITSGGICDGRSSTGAGVS